jgi:hypothetical protein
MSPKATVASRAAAGEAGLATTQLQGCFREGGNSLEERFTKYVLGR